MEILSGLRNVVFNAGYISIPGKMLVSLAHNHFQDKTYNLCFLCFCFHQNYLPR